MKNFAKRIFVALAPTFVASAAFAQEAAAGSADGGSRGMIALSAGLAIGLAAFGGALGQSKAASAALDGIARNPAAQGKIFTPMIIALALIESLVIYALIVAFALSGKI
jgi:F-type H+-transporting ATPase subunit c